MVIIQNDKREVQNDEGCDLAAEKLKKESQIEEYIIDNERKVTKHFKACIWII